MRGVKDLIRWVDSFGLSNPAPWASEPADWATALNILSRLLHRQLAERVEKDEKERRKSEEGEADEEEKRNRSRSPEQSQRHPGTQLPFQEALHLAESVLGAPQFAVLSDTKSGSGPDNQLALFVTLCSLRFAMGAMDTKPFRDFQFSFRIYFDMDTDDTNRFCAACGELVHLIERVLLEGRVWHRTCLKCALCGRQLYRGAMVHCAVSVAGDAVGLQCVEHFANRVLFGDPKHRLSLPATPSADQNKRASIATVTASPPPRPPPPKIGSANTTPMQRDQQEEEEESIEKKIALATAATHDAPVPKPRSTKPGRAVLSNVEMNRGGRGAGEGRTAWEVLEYPEELNPFGDAEIDHPESGGKNPFEEDEEEEEEDRSSPSSSSSGVDEQRRKLKTDQEEEEEEEEEGMVQVQNPQDRVQTCSSGPSACPSPAMVHIVEMAREHGEGKADQSDQQNAEKSDQKADQNVDQGHELVESRYQYISPLAPTPFRPFIGKPSDHPARPLSMGSSASDQHQHQLNELDTRLRKLHAQLDQWEITGARLEGQLLREMGNKEKPVWRKGAKLANEYAHVLEQRLSALAMEAVLVRRYMDTFLEVTHAELDRQMKELEQDPIRQRQFGLLLAHLLQMRNDLTELERRERSARASIAHETEEQAREAAAAKGKREKETPAKECGAEKQTTDTQSVSSTGTEGGTKKLLKLKGMKQSLAKTLIKKKTKS